MTEARKIIPVILSGGSGTRLWPLSRPDRPKQFLPLLSERTMLQMTADYVRDRSVFAPPIVIGGAAFGAETVQQMNDAGVQDFRVVLEPQARNTAPAIALAAAMAERGDDLLLIMPSDHAIRRPEALMAHIAQAAPLAREGWLCTFGIEPDSPHTGYGYIRAAEPLAAGVWQVGSFVEKPDPARARAMLEEGGYHWNAGIFLFRADAIMAALDTLQPAVAASVRDAMAGADRTAQTVHPLPAAFAASPSISIDHGVLEHHDRVAVVPAALGWSDVGSWDALYDVLDRDDQGNNARGPVFWRDARDCLVQSDGQRVALLGVQDLIVVVSGDDILVMSRGRSQEVRDLGTAVQEA